MNITTARIIFTGSTTDALNETISRDDFAAGRRAIMGELRGTGVRMVKEATFGTSLTSGGTRFAWDLYDRDSNAHVGYAWVDVAPVSSTHPVGATVRNVYTGAMSVVTGHQRNAEGIACVDTETTCGYASAYVVVDPYELADLAAEAEAATEAPATVTTYHVTRDSDRANSDMDAAMAHVDIVRTEVFADAVAGLLGYMIGEAQDLEALPVKLSPDNWAPERARAIRAGMDTVRTWSAESFAGGERWSRIHVTTRGLVFAITAVTR
ncbi:hypothetical protein [Nocardia phage NC1]|nr:hypothetical protein [Nocardia phage NC1]QSL67694.1 hypothetical protein [Nocardia phage P69]